jgi:hypothetical protein
MNPILAFSLDPGHLSPTADGGFHLQTGRLVQSASSEQNDAADLLGLRDGEDIRIVCCVAIAGLGGGKQHRVS